MLLQSTGERSKARGGSALSRASPAPQNQRAITTQTHRKTQVNDAKTTLKSIFERFLQRWPWWHRKCGYNKEIKCTLAPPTPRWLPWHTHTAAAGPCPSSPHHHLYHPQLCFLDNSLEGLIWTVYIVIQLILSFKAKILQLLCKYLLFYILHTGDYTKKCLGNTIWYLTYTMFYYICIVFICLTNYFTQGNLQLIQGTYFNKY